jgi:hypothetical protein
MSDQLAYIRQAASKGERAMVIRTKVDPNTGWQVIDAKILVNATTAFTQLSLPVNKRAKPWDRIYPIGFESQLSGKTMVQSKQDTNPLSDDELIQKVLANPELLKQLKAGEKALKKADKEPEQPVQPESETTDNNPLI